MDKQETYAYLKDRVTFVEVTEHPAVFNMAEVAEIKLPYPEVDAKNLFVRDEKHRNFYLITVMGNKRVNLKEFRKAHGLKSLSFASDDELMQYLGIIPGAVTPLGLLNDQTRTVHWYLDADFVMPEGLIGVHPNDNTATVWLKVKELIDIIQEHGNEVEVVHLSDGQELRQ